ncbi:hypothetical protein JCM19231_3489 [Vibrio ishigakensis]|uniref:Uncharacterized protein n=2 Tax=Vibrio ishigakensis TaxID=1481914 RepID=A0A0B8QCV5_9VIBR|nr:hypothetical protein JCM19231_3489 [Vibrio ishigakensis]GAM74772.1 hypothetical protein JCM19241_1115 [Vibrio ishigakensis]
MLGALVGGYYSAILSTRLSQATIRKVVIVISVGTTAYFFVQAISDLI